MSRLIDAEELENKVADLYSEGEDATEGDKVVNDVIDLIDNAPTVSEITKEKLAIAYEQGYKDGKNNWLQEERPRGEWQLHGMIYYCSKCGHECGESGDNFCGNCGADMREVKDEQTN